MEGLLEASTSVYLVFAHFLLMSILDEAFTSRFYGPLIKCTEVYILRTLRVVTIQVRLA